MLVGSVELTSAKQATKVSGVVILVDHKEFHGLSIGADVLVVDVKGSVVNVLSAKNKKRFLICH